MNESLNAELIKRREKLIQRNLRRAYWSRNWSLIATGIIFIYVLLPFVAPTLMKVGAEGAGKALYTAYYPMCHQFAFRSMFLYGEQFTYPRETVGKGGMSFDERAAQSPTFVRLFEEERRKELRAEGRLAEADAYTFQGPEDLTLWSGTLQKVAKRFNGDEQMGYKVGICARDVAIYGGMVVGGAGFLLVRRRLRPVPLPLYALLGLSPIAIDGFSQMFGYAPFEFWATRETSPEFRVLTGALFGLMNIWLAYPYLERSFLEGAARIEATVASIRKSS